MKLGLRHICTGEASATGVTRQIGTAGLLALLLAPAVSGAEIRLALQGKAQLDIVVSPQADTQVRQAAADLAGYLQQISGASFKVQEGNGKQGLVLGLPANFTDLGLNASFGGGPFERDHYRITSTSQGLYLLGASPTAVEFAVWDLLHQFGYRYYFPSPAWEVIPEESDLRIDVDRHERPDFYNRSAPRGGIRVSLQPWLQQSWRDWQVRNRTASSFQLNTGHAYDGILRRHREEFQRHPEYLALREGERGGNKFCISNKRLRELVVRDAVTQIRQSPERDSISLDPSDGGGWCECDACERMGTVSDRVVSLANEAAVAINQLGLGEKFVGTYAYNYHSPPPRVKAHANVIVSLATAFIKSDQTFEEMLAGWSKQAELIGIREYYGLSVWHQSMPGSAKAARPMPLAQSIREQHAAGARFMNAESDNAWGPNGLGYYLASRLVWDVAVEPQAVIDDFLQNCFGDAVAPMREFYAFMGSGPRHSDHMVGRMYRLLKRARELDADPQVRRRIDDLTLYTKYVELYRGLRDQASFDRLVRYLWRTRTRNMCDAISMFSYLNRSARSNPEMTWTPGKPASRTLPPERLRTGGDEPFTESEILSILEDGIRNHDVLAFTPLEFSDDLVPLREGPEELAALGERFFGGNEGTVTTRGELDNYTWISDPPQEIRLQVQTGLIYDVRGPATVTLAHRGAIGVERLGFRDVQQAVVPEDRQWHEVRLTATERGLYRIRWSERMTGTRVKWPAGLPRAVSIHEGADKQVSGRHSWHFYVPQGTKVIGAYSQARAGGVFDPSGKQVFPLASKQADYVTLEVPAGQDGKFWSVRNISGRFRLLTVPPYGFGSASDALLPRELNLGKPPVR